MLKASIYVPCLSFDKVLNLVASQAELIASNTGIVNLLGYIHLWPAFCGLHGSNRCDYAALNVHTQDVQTGQKALRQIHRHTDSSSDQLRWRTYDSLPTH